MSDSSKGFAAGVARVMGLAAQVHPLERRAVGLAFLCNFVLLGSYYILRPLRDTVATIFGANQLQLLFTATFIGTLVASPLYAALASRFRLSRLLPGVFWFWLFNVLLFQVLYQIAPQNRAIAAAYYIWFSVVNLYMISVFWSLMVDIFSAAQATRLFALIAAGGSIGAIAGPILTRLLVKRLHLSGLLLLAAAGFLVVIVLVHMLIREKERLKLSGEQAQQSTLNHGLSGNPFQGFGTLLRSSFMLNQAAFMLLMTWVNTVAYYLQTDLIAHAFAGIDNRVQAIADIDLVVNILSALILSLGMGRLVQRFGVTTGLVLNPLIMLVAFLAVAFSPTLLVVQAIQVVRRVSQYAIARPSREICFTVVDQTDRYKAKNVIDTVMYRFGDVSSAWVQTGLRALGFGLAGTVGVGLGTSVLWGMVAAQLGRRYEKIRKGSEASGELLYSPGP